MSSEGLESQFVLDGLSQGVLIFDGSGQLIQENTAARVMLGADLNLLKSTGWSAAVVLLNARLADADETVERVHTLAVISSTPQRFHIYRVGERIPCWISAIHRHDQTYTMLTIENQDWSMVTDVIEKYLDEVREVVSATRGHADLITQTVTHAKPDETVERLGMRIGGFTRIIDIHMYRLYALTDLIERLELIRTGKMYEVIEQTRRRVVVADFMEDFLEVLDETPLLDPESETGDNRARVRAVIPRKIAVDVSPGYLSQILRDLLRNAIMYSGRATLVKIVAYANRSNTIQIDVIDEGCGIRAVEGERVFLPFMRSRQPQVMSEFGYGLSLYLCKHEVEAMNGRIWFESEEGVGTTFSLKLPVWRDTRPASSSEG